MSSYILVGGKYDDKRWWNDLVRACAVIGDNFEIHCWPDEKTETMAALKYGHKVTASWSGGTVIRGRITKEFLSFLTEAKKPTDTQIYNKMTPFFTITFGNRLHSEHYGTKIVISKVARENQPTVDRILDQMSDVGTVHRNLGGGFRMKKRKWVWLTLALVLVLCVIMLNNPRIRSNLFVRLYHEQIEEGLKMNAGVPADDAVLFGYESVNTWPGEHTMVEFLISGFGLGSATSYYGCYYSPDDVPLAFQNVDIKLTQCGHDSWKWSERGDNHGKTMKIMDRWYYFEASF